MGRKLPDWLSTSHPNTPEDIPNIKICPKCGADGRVMDSRVTRAGTIVRRRIFPKCRWLWKTVEFMATDPKLCEK